MTDRGFLDLPSNLIEALERAATSFPDRGIALFDGRGRSHERREYPEVLAAVRQAAGRWTTLGVEPGDRVMVCLPTSWDWFDAWMGALHAGALPVAVATGSALGAAEAHLLKVESLADRLRPRYLVGRDVLGEELVKRGPSRASEAFVSLGAVRAQPPGALHVLPTAPDDVAFLQLTSGSTGTPSSRGNLAPGGVAQCCR